MPGYHHRVIPTGSPVISDHIGRVIIDPRIPRFAACRPCLRPRRRHPPGIIIRSVTGASQSSTPRHRKLARLSTAADAHRVIAPGAMDHRLVLPARINSGIIPVHFRDCASVIRRGVRPAHSP
ncbi:hypothetical protein NPIL_294031 [Nephila pilipes]|uniref:Uncharacterized protein n=1 Tax=Nephila pilipes TaxID=299642 RepID=A0A8X6U4M3_NEPPI|nr:hypothetical protein NPIL_294031 [Nephila pilipes]